MQHTVHPIDQRLDTLYVNLFAKNSTHELFELLTSNLPLRPARNFTTTLLRNASTLHTAEVYTTSPVTVNEGMPQMRGSKTEADRPRGQPYDWTSEITRRRRCPRGAERHFAPWGTHRYPPGARRRRHQAERGSGA